MQAMAATCLSDVMSDLRPTVASLLVEATGTIKKRMSELRALGSPLFSPDLGFAVFALGMLWQWTNPLSCENVWLGTARELVQRWGQGLEDEAKITYVYFYQALTYLEMLHTPFGRGPITTRLHDRWRQREERLSQGKSPPDVPTRDVPFKTICPGTRPNSWCGVSNEVIDVFGQVIALCRVARARRRGELEIGSLDPILCDIFLAHELQNELEAMDFTTIILQEEAQGAVVHTDDDKTPVAHLLLTAEAYRQAAMLQLHLEFESLSAQSDDVDRPLFLLRLALQLLNTLDQIPIESGAKTTHLMLYMSVASALNRGVTDLAWAFEMARARRLVWERLQRLRQQLPSDTGKNTMYFVKELWEQRHGGGIEHDWKDICWLDMLAEHGSPVMLWSPTIDTVQ